MWFRCSGGNGTGDGATITVTYSSQFYNKTMTCSNGTKTYTKITTSSGSTVFDVDESGTWTITCDGTSRTVDVVLEYSTQMSITKTITVYGAASETISFTDVTGAKTVTTNGSGQGSVSITFIPPSQNITFTSSIAKDPNNLSQAYSKAITINNNTTSIYVMPNDALYWYGNMTNLVSGVSIEACSSANGWSIGGGCDFNTNDIGLYRPDASLIQGVSTSLLTSNYTMLKVINTGVSAAGGTYASCGKTSTKSNNNVGDFGDYTTSGLNLKTFNLSGVSNNYLVIANNANNRNLKIHAIMLE